MPDAYDLIVIGAGSIGVPVAMEFAKKGQSVLVIDSLASPGQGQDKKAIGGIRATHSDRGKILISQRSIEVFSHWKEMYGDDIQWKSNGYSFPAYTEKDEDMLRDLMKIQQSFGLNIRWLSPEEYRELNSGISMKGLRGSTYSPEDGSASPLLFTQSCYFKSVEYGAEFKFSEPVVGFTIEHGKITSVNTDRGAYHSANVLNAAGAYARGVSQMAGIDIPVNADSHEAGIS
ncbi:MAG: FAD-binding oxidoreductase, partial [Deltaproteobacteria bacterium]